VIANSIFKKIPLIDHRVSPVSQEINRRGLREII
jgi:hypothetical protein